ncbi:efflux RND transporter periplasmic adaptor subunit [Maledivibacter halophilus]|uniref:HlyD family secretion protein n=1 Tax=Maledivibacter halophilus TaxID=36842 RepID=A0A1T5JW20_9FIRM|nr:efflux RND transporter periplasmic adaptor subunit [Maledivibacter halophilus]SKC55585.1 HlyD family secretion protein [Maledivibacter halophilus]
MGKPKKKTVLIILVLVIVTASISLAAVNTVKSKQETGISVKTTAIIKKDIESNIFTSGTVISKNYVDVTSDISGKIKEVSVEEGMKVKKGDILGKIDSDNLKFELKQNEIKLDIAKDKLNQLKRNERSNIETNFKNAEIEYKDAKKDYEDKKELLKAGAISENDLQESKSEMKRIYNDYVLAKKKYDDADNLSGIKTQEKQIKSMEIEIDRIKSNIEKSDIISPIDGTVIEVNISELSVVNAEALMFKVQDTENLEVQTNISEYDIGKVKIGQPVNVTCDGADEKVYEGTVAYISPNAIIEKNGQGTETIVKVKIDINDKDTKLKPNFSANVEIKTASKKDALVVPYEAIYTDKSGEKSIYIVENNKAQKAVIDTGLEGDMLVEIIGDGFKEGDNVILNPTEMIQDGTDIKTNNM